MGGGILYSDTGLYILDMWSVLCVLSCAGGEIKYSDRTVRIGHVVSVGDLI